MGKEDKILVYPNPFRDVTKVEVLPSETGVATIDLSDIKGKLIKRVFSGLVEKNVYRNFPVNSMGLPAGVYVIKMSTSTKVTSRKIILVR